MQHVEERDSSRSSVYFSACATSGPELCSCTFLENFFGIIFIARRGEGTCFHADLTGRGGVVEPPGVGAAWRCRGSGVYRVPNARDGDGIIFFIGVLLGLERTDVGVPWCPGDCRRSGCCAGERPTRGRRAEVGTFSSNLKSLFSAMYAMSSDGSIGRWLSSTEALYNQ